MATTYDAIIIGTGQAGPSLAVRLAGAGMKVAIVERSRFGGTCVNTGCIPTKTLVEVLVLGVTLRAGGPDLALVIALSLANVPEALSGTAGMRLASRSSTYVLILWSGTALITAAITALAFYFLSDLGPHATAILKAYGAGALIAMTAESMIPEAFHNGPRYSGVLAAGGFAAPILLGELAR